MPLPSRRHVRRETTDNAMEEGTGSTSSSSKKFSPWARMARGESSSSNNKKSITTPPAMMTMSGNLRRGRRPFTQLRDVSDVPKVDKVPTPRPSRTPSSRHAFSTAPRPFVLELSDHLQDIEDSYMLSVYLPKDETSTVTTESSTSSVSSTRPRPRGAYHKRIQAGRTANQTWLDSMMTQSTGRNGGWTPTSGWQITSKWDSTPDDRWGTLDPVFDQGLTERAEI
eukprot:Nitzschia sp. Nitz4//scaffold136_size62208//33075//33749//NITZ4_006371-RA/size62208-processed-gene-0.13-mRNA-1//1//CDS//3329535627//2645//frame0